MLRGRNGVILGGRRRGRRRRERGLGGLERGAFVIFIFACMGLREFNFWVSWILLDRSFRNFSNQGLFSLELYFLWHNSFHYGLSLCFDGRTRLSF